MAAGTIADARRAASFLRNPLLPVRAMSIGNSAGRVDTHAVLVPPPRPMRSIAMFAVILAGPPG
jgi:hypothetical protein